MYSQMKESISEHYSMQTTEDVIKIWFDLIWNPKVKKQVRASLRTMWDRTD